MVPLRIRLAIAALLIAGVVVLATTGSGFAALGIAVVAGAWIVHGRRRAAR